MKRLASVILACLITIPCVTLNQHLLPSSLAHAQASRSSSTPLESTLVQQDSQGVSALGPSHEGHYRGQTIDSGVQVSGCGGRAEFHLGGQYDWLALTLSSEGGFGNTITIIIEDTSNPAAPHLLFRRDIVALAQVQTHIHVSGIQFLTIRGPCNPCGAIDLRGTFTKGTAPTTHINQVVPRFPTGNAGVPAESKVLFGWQPFPRATNYALHIWLVGLNGSTALKPTTPFSFSASVYHKISYNWNDHGFLPGTYQYTLLPLDDQGHNLAGWSTPVQITIAS